MEIESLKQIVEGVLLAASGPMSLNQINALFPDEEKPGHGAIKEALAALDAELEGRAVELVEVGSGYRIQIRTRFMPVVSRLWSEKPPRYSRALLETLAIIAYRQPITRGDIEQIRGVAVSSNILRTLQERDWIKVVGHRDVPGRPELLGTTRAFLDYFNLKSLDQLPTLAEIKDIDNLEPELQLTHPAPPDNGQPSKDQHQDGEADSEQPEDELDERKDISDESEENPAAEERENEDPEEEDHRIEAAEAANDPGQRARQQEDGATSDEAAEARSTDRESRS
jgi:segregation and condensation protein B